MDKTDFVNIYGIRKGLGDVSRLILFQSIVRRQGQGLISNTDPAELACTSGK
jgi:hypothetical protein